MPVALYFFAWSGMEEKERKNESESVLAGQAGMKVTGWLRL